MPQQFYAFIRQFAEQGPMLAAQPRQGAAAATAGLEPEQVHDSFSPKPRRESFMRRPTRVRPSSSATRVLLP